VEARDEVSVVSRGVVTRTGESAPGSGFPVLGASEGRRTPQEEGRVEVVSIGRHGGGADEDEEAVLEGGRKARSGITPAEVHRPVAARRKTPGSTSRDAKDEGGAAKPDEQLRRAVRR
jgi:hypothetical protein